MDYKIEYPQPDTAVITFQISKDQLEEAMKEAAKATGSEDENVNRDAAINVEIGKVGAEAMQNEKLKLAVQPAVTYNTDDQGAVLVDINCTLVPEVKLGKFTGFDVVVEPAEVTDEEVDAKVNADLQAKELWEPLPADAEAKNGDRVIIDYIGEKDGIPFDGGSAKAFPLVLGSGQFIPGFEDQLIGIKAGEERDVKLSFPENYPVPDLAGAPVVFHVKCNLVQEHIEPALNDAFIEKMKLDGVRNVEQFKEKIKADMLETKKHEAEEKALAEVMDKILAEVEINIPSAMIESLIDQYVAQTANQMQQFGLTMDQYLQMTGMNMEQLRESMAGQAEADIKASLTLEAIAEKENIKASEEEINEEYSLLSSMYGMPAEQLKMMIPAGGIAYQLNQKKTTDFLKETNLKK